MQGVPKLLHLHQIFDVSAIILVDLLDAFICALIVNFIPVVIIANVIISEVIIVNFFVRIRVNQEIFLIRGEEGLAAGFADTSLSQLTHTFEVIDFMMVVIFIVVVEVGFMVISVSIGAHFIFEGSEIRRGVFAILKMRLATDISIGLELDFSFSFPLAVGITGVGLRVLAIIRPVGVTRGHLRLWMLSVRVLEGSEDIYRLVHEEVARGVLVAAVVPGDKFLVVPGRAGVLQTASSEFLRAAG
jgi:hypothetical protein